jgi:hypothetical protein
VEPYGVEAMELRSENNALMERSDRPIISSESPIAFQNFREFSVKFHGKFSLMYAAAIFRTREGSAP